MLVARTIHDTRMALADPNRAGKTIGLVPTMGFLHDGHMELVRHARMDCDIVVATIFVNPTQFGDPKDLDTYPRDEDRDLKLLEQAGVDLVFIPTVDQIYPDGDETIVETTRLANMLHGLVRPGHFRGVTTVVARLFNIVQPNRAFFGEKDYQQLQIIKRMVYDLHFPIDIIGVPTQREPDGLARSSRNVKLSPEDRAAAVVLSQALDAAERMGGAPVEDIRHRMEETIASEPRATLRGLDIVAAKTLDPISDDYTGPIAIMMSVEFDGVLLIDQREINT